MHQKNPGSIPIRDLKHYGDYPTVTVPSSLTVIMSPS